MNQYINTHSQYEVKAKPEKHLLRIIQEGELHTCTNCGSSIKTKWFGLKKLGCIHPKCENYYKKEK
jgi:hypothetical protein